MNELRRLIVRHRHVAPLVAQLLAGTDAQVTIRDTDGETILDRGGAEFGERFPITAEYDTIGTVEGGRTARVVAAVLSYAASRERDKRSLANEALERYRELSIIYDLAEGIGQSEDEAAVGDAIVQQLERLPGSARGFVLAREANGTFRAVAASVGFDPTSLTTRANQGIVGSVCGDAASPELVDDPHADERATPGERAGGAIVVAPLRAGGRTTGVLGGVAAATGGFTAADLKVVSAIAALAGPALEQARRHEASLLHRTGRDHGAAPAR